ncbi:hypothetical protein [Buttiauxella sp. B2]|uniref:hypothetical protein n=1 Tax=Buttiauxella sp. B2 TaxID=2587812 RepID=UPI001675F1D6|nr:hypothetical protein [Buttiauxella sp. B2]
MKKILISLTVIFLSLLIGGSIELSKNSSLNCEAIVDLDLDHCPGQPHFTGLYIIHVSPKGKGTLRISGNVIRGDKTYTLSRTTNFGYNNMSLADKTYYMQTTGIIISEHDNTPNDIISHMFGAKTKQAHRMFKLQRVLEGSYLISNVADSSIPSLVCSKSDNI